MSVYVTHGRKFHINPACPLMVNGEDLHDCEGDQDWGYGGFTAGSYRHEVSTPAVAASRGKLPCLGCVPPEQRAFPPLYGQTFGHEPAALRNVIHENWTRHSACQTCRAGTTGLVCGTCMEIDASGMWRIPAHPIHWPCTSAVVLGLVPRQAAVS